VAASQEILTLQPLGTCMEQYVDIGGEVLSKSSKLLHLKTILKLTCLIPEVGVGVGVSRGEGVVERRLGNGVGDG
jgi:hypothetical protein